MFTQQLTITSTPEGEGGARKYTPETESTSDAVENSLRMQVACGATLKKGEKNTTLLQFHQFPPDLAGLIAARKVCRSEMAKIVNEVDLVTKSPKLAIDTTRDEFFLEPAVYKQLLPVSQSHTA